MAEIDKALLDYSVANGYLPMPSNLNCTAGQINYGASCSTVGNGNGNFSTCAANNGDYLPCTYTTGSPSGTAEGGIPTRALKLPDNYQYDAWGNRIEYAVNELYTASDSFLYTPNTTANRPFPPSIQTGGCLIPYNGGNSGPIIYDSTYGSVYNLRSNTAAYALISHGQNGSCGWTAAGVVSKNNTSTTMTNTAEKQNCNNYTYNYYGCVYSGNNGQLYKGSCNRPPQTPGNHAVTGSNIGSYVQMLPQSTAGTLGGNFDDIVTYKEPWQLQTLGAPMQQQFQTCMYTAGGGTYSVNEFAFPLGYGSAPLSTYPISGAQTYYYDSYISFDTSGSLWAVTPGHNNVQQFSPNGAVYSSNVTLPASNCTFNGCASGAANNQFYYPAGVAPDLSGNVWVSDAGNNRLQEFNATTGAYEQTIPPACSGIACTITSGNGNFNNPQNLIVDTGGNIWVADDYNNRVQELNYAGTWLQTIGTGPGAANGVLFNPTDVARDSAGNVWVADTGNNRIQEFSSGGTWIQTIPSTGCQTASTPACPSSATIGQFSAPAGLAIDPNGSLWVSDTGNNRLQTFSLSSTASGYISTYPSAASGSCPNSSPPACYSGYPIASPMGMRFYR